MKRFSTVYRAIIFAVLGATALFAANGKAPQFPSGKQTLWYLPQDNLDAKTYANFPNELFMNLSADLSEIGYTLRNYSAKDSLSRSVLSRDNLCMYVHLGDSVIGREPGPGVIAIDLCKMGELAAARSNPSVFRPLLSLAYSPDDPASFRSVLVKKIVENLRTQYICNVIITSEPSGVRVKTQNSLIDLTPLEWIVPVGTLHVQCVKDKYIVLNKDLLFAKPGSYSYFFQMKKKQFYNSGFFYPALAVLASSAVCYYFDNYYYGRYSRLGKPDYSNSPGSFPELFQKAKNFENASVVTLASGCCLLGLTFCF
jgi:hypothetical protein